MEAFHLPPGFRFHPTDEELLLHYLQLKTATSQFSYLNFIPDIDLSKYDPWEIPSKVGFGENEWYFFSMMGRKYPNGSRLRRDSGCGYWKATGTDKTIMGTDGQRLGSKKSLVFYVGKLPSGTKTDWITHEYRLFRNNDGNQRKKQTDIWAVYRLYKKRNSCSSKMRRNVSRECDDLTYYSDDTFPFPPAMDDRSSGLDQNVSTAVGIATDNQQERFTSDPPACDLDPKFSHWKLPENMASQINVEDHDDGVFIPWIDDFYGLCNQFDLEVM